MKYELIIFDLDGTILDTLEDLTNSVNYSLNKFGYPVRTITEIRSFVGNGIKKLLERSAPKEITPDELDNIHKIFTEHYAIHCKDNTKPYDGIIDVIKELRKAGLKTAVVSNKADYAVQLLCEQYFDGLFDMTVGAKDNVNKKPAPDSVNAVLDKLSISRTNAVYIGDSDVDIATAKNAQMDCICVDWGFRDVALLKENGATVIVSSPKELLRKLRFVGGLRSQPLMLDS